MAPDIEERLNAIRDDRSRGASQLATEALALLRDAACGPHGAGADLVVEARAPAARVIELRPSMAPIANWALTWCEALAAEPGEPARVAAVLEARRAQMAADQLNAAREALARAVAVVTLSYSATVAAIVTALPGIERVVVGEGRPGLEGRRLAEAARDVGKTVELVTDAQLAHFTAQSDAVLLGADTVCRDLAVVNKVGSLAAALGAARGGVPSLVAADSFKINPMVTGQTVPLEEMDPAEVWPEHPELCRSIYFEAVPVDLIHAFITEKGVLTPEQMAGEVARWRALRERFSQPTAAR